MRSLALALAVLLLLSLALAAYAVQRLGGWRYTLYRLEHREAGLYRHRIDLFERLPDRPGAVVFLGDSHVEQCEWAELTGLPNALNRGITGDHTQGVLARLKETLRHRPRLIVLMVGINDLLLGRSAEETAADYRQIVRQIRRESPQTELLLISVLPVNPQIKRIRIDNALIRSLNAQIAALAREYALPYIDLYAECADAEQRLSARLTDDGIHLNGQGYILWKKNIARYWEN